MSSQGQSRSHVSYVNQLTLLTLYTCMCEQQTGDTQCKYGWVLTVTGTCACVRVCVCVCVCVCMCVRVLVCVHECMRVIITSRMLLF